MTEEKTNLCKLGVSKSQQAFVAHLFGISDGLIELFHGFKVITCMKVDKAQCQSSPKLHQRITLFLIMGRYPLHVHRISKATTVIHLGLHAQQVIVTIVIVGRQVVRSYFRKLEDNLAVDVAIVGAGPSGLVAARDLALAGAKVAVFESKLAPGGGTWGGGMLMNEVVVQNDAAEILHEFGISTVPVDSEYHTVDSVEMASGLIFGARKAGAVIFNTVKVEDIVIHDGVVCGVVINWNPVARLDMHVDPIVITTRALVDGTGHPSEIIAKAVNKAGVKIDSPTGGILGEKPMWMEDGERTTVENTKRLYPGLYASGMAANNVQGGFRMGPIFGGMFKSGRKIAKIILDDLKA